MLDQRLANGFAAAVHQLDDVGREPRLEEDLDQKMDSVGDVFGGLDHHGISAQERREHLPRGDRERKIEWRDEPDHADGAAVAHRPLRSELRRNHVAEEAATFSGRVIGRVDSLLDIAS